MKSKIILILIVILAAGVVAFVGQRAYLHYQERARQRVILEQRQKDWNTLKKDIGQRIHRHKGVVGIVIKDLDTNWEMDFNKGLPIPSASLVKIPLMLTCFYAANDGLMTFNDLIILKSSDRVPGSRVLGKSPVGTVFTVEQLLDPMITQSDNVAANILINFMGFDTIDRYFKKMGLANTNLSRKMMDFEERSEGVENYTTAADMAMLLEQLYRKNFLSKAISEKCLALLGDQKINDRIPRNLPKCEILIAHKTGLENHICHDVGIVYTKKGNFLICVLVKHENRYAQPAKQLIADIALFTYNYYQRR
jgi:beta-lactamase class A